ncbi:hypothetical protein [Teredinibacter purpureus]|uniref:hypothetical protein n=1 Tax=Teredinibacter purpureus TaxID=2731756 RepID=UPI0005F827CF|nr:hypothetical protein [Teredinibacter purpureus]
MSKQKVTCEKCSRKTPRNMYNKCIYCGEAYKEEYHFSQSEKDEKLVEIEEANAAQERQLDDYRKKEKEKEVARRKIENTTHHNGGLF